VDAPRPSSGTWVSSIPEILPIPLTSFLHACTKTRVRPSRSRPRLHRLGQNRLAQDHGFTG
jgi:hypothetical protein